MSNPPTHDDTARRDDRPAPWSGRASAGGSWWSALGAWLQLRRAAAEAEQAFETAKARRGSRTEAAEAAYKALTGETRPAVDDGPGDISHVRRRADGESGSASWSPTPGGLAAVFRLPLLGSSTAPKGLPGR